MLLNIPKQLLIGIDYQPGWHVHDGETWEPSPVRKISYNSLALCYGSFIICG
jgi:hypothetical protein